MRFLDALLRAEREIERRIDKAFGRGAARTPLELRREILDEVESRIAAAPEGKIFPFGALAIHLEPGDEAMRRIFQAVFVEGGSLVKEVRQLLQQAGCRSAGAVEIVVNVGEPAADPARKNSFDLEFTSVSEQKPRKRKVRPPELTLEVVRGTAEPALFHGARTRVYLGRLKEVLDKEGQVIRRNDLAFADNGDEINSTVGRAHATVFFDEAKGDYRIVDEASRYGTRIFRENRSIEVPPGKSSGVKLRPGDEIYLGRASLRFS